MKVLKYFCALPLLAASLWAASPAVPDAILPEGIYPALDAILKQAVLQSPVMLNRALDLEIAENSRIAARAQLLPSAGGYINVNRSKDTNDYVYKLPIQNNKTTYWTTQTPYAFSISQPIYHWGALKNSAKIGEIQQAITKGQYRDGYRMFAQSLRMEYLRLIVLKISVAKASFYRDFSKNILVYQETLLAKKAISELQMFPVRLQAEQAQIASDRADFEFEMAKASFARLAGTPPIANDSIPGSIPVIPYLEATFNKLLADFLEQKELPSMEAYTARKQLEIENLNYAITKTRLRPKANLTTGVTQNVQHNLYGTVDTYQVTSLYAGIGVSWSVFDGFASRSYARNSLLRRRQMERDYKGLTERLAQQAQTQVKQINFTARSMSITDRALVSAEWNLKTQQDEFARGSIPEDGVSWTRIALFDAQINAYNNRIDFLGRIGDFLGTVVEDPVLGNLADK